MKNWCYENSEENRGIIESVGTDIQNGSIYTIIVENSYDLTDGNVTFTFLEDQNLPSVLGWRSGVFQRRLWRPQTHPGGPEGP